MVDVQRPMPGLPGPVPPPLTTPIPLARSDLSSLSLLAILTDKPVLSLGPRPGGHPVVLALDEANAAGAPADAEVWTMGDLALAALLDPGRLALVLECKRTMPGFRIPPPHPPAPEGLRLPPAAVDVPPDLPGRIRQHMAAGPPILYAGWANSGRKTGVGTVMPAPVFYVRSDSYRATGPALGEIWTADELAAWLAYGLEERDTLRRWKQEHGRWAVVE